MAAAAPTEKGTEPQQEEKHKGLSQREAQLSATVEDLLKQAIDERAELRVQLKAQWDLNQKRTEQLQKGLDRAEDDRMQLRSELASLTEEFDALAAKYREEVGMRERVRRKGIKGRGAQSRMAYRPTLEYAEKQPSHVCELNHLSLAQLAMLGDHCARRERLLREVMAVDQITWGEAHEVLTSFDKYNEKYYWFETLPYRIAITLAFIGGVSSFVMVFWGPVAEWYGVNIVGESLPETAESVDSMTFNQVGTWTWTWMEPMLGTASFVILCAQFTRAQASKMNMKTYSDRILQWRANRLSKKFPQYDASMLQAWAKHLPKVGYDFFPKYEAHFRQKGPASGL